MVLIRSASASTSNEYPHYVNIMNLIGATYIRASKLSSHASQVGWPDLTEFDFRPRLTSNLLHELQYNVCQQYFSSSETLPPNLWDFYPTRSREFGCCLVTSSSAMEALCSPSSTGGGHAFQKPKTSVCR